MHILERTITINRPLNEVFDFFSKADNLEKITPTNVNFRILTPQPIKMQKGTMIDYKIKLNGIPMKWRTEITDWQPGIMFADNQVKGPYVRWYHQHFFKDLGNGTTEMTDRVEYLSPGWILEPIINAVFVKNEVEKIFDHRNKVILSLFA